MRSGESNNACADTSMLPRHCRIISLVMLVGEVEKGPYTRIHYVDEHRSGISGQRRARRAEDLRERRLKPTTRYGRARLRNATRIMIES